jgi:hypothetical protein
MNLANTAISPGATSMPEAATECDGASRHPTRNRRLTHR